MSSYRRRKIAIDFQWQIFRENSRRFVLGQSQGELANNKQSTIHYGSTHALDVKLIFDFHGNLQTWESFSIVKKFMRSLTLQVNCKLYFVLLLTTIYEVRYIKKL